MSTPRSEFWSGVRAETPILIGVIPFGLIYGVLAQAAGIPPLLAIAMSSVVFAGSSQVVGANLIKMQTPGIVILFTTAIINLRHALYSASLSPYLKRLSLLWRMLLAYLMTDEAYAVAIAHYTATDSNPPSPDYRHWYLFGAGLALWSCWQTSTAIGVLLGAQVPASWSLDFTLALTFIALVIPALKDRPAIAATITAGILAVLCHDLPYNLGLMIAALAGITVGTLLESRFAPQPMPNENVNVETQPEVSGVDSH